MVTGDFLPSLRRQGCSPTEGKSGGLERFIHRDWKCLRGETGIHFPAGRLVELWHLQAHVTGPPLQHPDLSSGSTEAGPVSGLQVSGGWQLAGAVRASRMSRDHGVDGLGRKALSFWRMSVRPESWWFWVKEPRVEEEEAEA